MLQPGVKRSVIPSFLDLITGGRAESVDPVSPTASVDPTAQVADTLIDDDVVVAADAIVEGSLLLPGARVDRGARVRASIVAGTVGDAAEVEHSVIGDTYAVPPRASVFDERLPRSHASHQP